MNQQMVADVREHVAEHLDKANDELGILLVKAGAKTASEFLPDEDELYKRLRNTDFNDGSSVVGIIYMAVMERVSKMMGVPEAEASQVASMMFLDQKDYINHRFGGDQ